MKDQIRVQGKTRSQEPLLGPAGQLIKDGQQRASHGMGGYPTPLTKDRSQVGGAFQMKVRFHTRQDPALQKLRAVGHGPMQATECSKSAHAHRKSNGTQKDLHGEKGSSRSNRHEVSLRKERPERKHVKPLLCERQEVGKKTKKNKKRAAFKRSKAKTA